MRYFEGNLVVGYIATLVTVFICSVNKNASNLFVFSPDLTARGIAGQYRERGGEEAGRGGRGVIRLLSFSLLPSLELFSDVRRICFGNRKQR